MRSMTDRPLVLDFDGSVGTLPGACVIALGDWHQRIRFGCTMRTFSQLRRDVALQLPDAHGPVFTGSGDFHHTSLMMIERLAHRGPMDVVVLDNHPDNMRFPWGIHCGSWVSHVVRLPFVRQVHVMGITSSDVAWNHALENRLAALWRGRLSYWCVGVHTRWADRVGLGRAVRSFDSIQSMLEVFAQQQRDSRTPIYLSIDKDVMSPLVVRTNWDQGRMDERELMQAIALVRPRLIGSDVTGDVSVARYESRWKRWLSALDAQPEFGAAELAQWQSAQRQLNNTLLQALAVH